MYITKFFPCFVYGLNEAILNELWFYMLLRNYVLPIPYKFYDDLNKDIEMQMLKKSKAAEWATSSYVEAIFGSFSGVLVIPL